VSSASRSRDRRQKGATSGTMFSNLGPTLVLLRELRGKSQIRLAQEAGLPKSVLSLYETGGQLPKLDSLERVLEALKIEPVELFSTLEMVDRRAAALDAPDGAFPLLRSSLLSEQLVQGFNSLLLCLLALRGSLLRHAALAWQAQVEAQRATDTESSEPADQDDATPSSSPAYRGRTP